MNLTAKEAQIALNAELWSGHTQMAIIEIGTGKTHA